MKNRFIPALLLAVAIMQAAEATDTTLPMSVRGVLDLRQIPHESLSVYVEDLGTGEPVVRWLEDLPRNPASTMKLLTTLVALDLLGPAYTWRTEVYSPGDVDDGRLDGDLLIKGYGDPFLVIERVWQLLRRIRQTGIHDVAGDLLIDNSYFDVAEHDPAAFDGRPLRAYNVAPDALLMNFKVVRYWFEPDTEAHRVRVWLDPPLENIHVENRLVLAPGPCRGYQRGITMTVNDAINTVTFSGKFPESCHGYALDRTMLDHGEYAFGLFSSLWRESGGRFDGDWSRAAAPADMHPIVTFESLPLADLIARVNKHSNNVMARQVLYTVSAERLGVPGTEAGGRMVVRDWLAANEFEFDGLMFDNGTGLSRDARISAREFGSLLRYAWAQPYMPEYLASMPLSGLDGTLSDRFDDAELTGMAHLKTGSLDHVSAIAGFMQSRSGRRFAVVMLHNYQDIHRGSGDEAQTALLRWLYEQ